MDFFEDDYETLLDNGRQAVLFVVNYNTFSKHLLLHKIKDLFYENIEHKIGCIVFNHPLESMPSSQNSDILVKSASSDGVCVVLPLQIATKSCYDVIKSFDIDHKSYHKSDFEKVLFLITHSIKDVTIAKSIVFITDDNYDVQSKIIITKINDIIDQNSDCQLVGNSNLCEIMTKDFNIFESKPKKASSDTTLKLGAIDIGVKVFMLYKQFSMPKVITLSKKAMDTPDIVGNSIDEQEDAEYEIVGPVCKGKAVEYVMDDLGGKKGKIKVVYTPEEQVALRNICDIGIEILKVVPLTMDPIGLKESKFFFPSDLKIKNSSKIFTALLQVCWRQRKALIVRFRTSKSMVPRHGYCIPRLQLLRNGVQIAPAGFYMIELATSDDLRYPVSPETVTVADELVNGFTELLNNTKVLNYLDIKDPYLEAHRSKLETLILEENRAVENQFNDLSNLVYTNMPSNLHELVLKYSSTKTKRGAKANHEASKKLK
eukprot:NODE_336_length_10675_cov_0.185136.p2 type:complete len:486 gc:universal NODE_336_length_10675_cov_0.185136:9006-7549(-)